jgi:GH43 family beta-xylosidase
METPWTIKTLPKAVTDPKPDWTLAVYGGFAPIFAAVSALATQKDTLHIHIQGPASASDEQRDQLKKLGCVYF